MIENWGGEQAAAFFGASVIGGLVAIGILFAILLFAAVYIYFALAWQTIAKKMKHKNPWLAWIPFANIAMLLQLGGFHWAWIFLALAPIIGWIPLYVLFIIASWRIFDKRKYPGWFALSLIIPKVGPLLYGVAIGFAAWDKK